MEVVQLRKTDADATKAAILQIFARRARCRC